MIPLEARFIRNSHRAWNVRDRLGRQKHKLAASCPPFPSNKAVTITATNSPLGVSAVVSAVKKRQRFFKDHMEAICTISLKITAKFEVNEHLFLVSLREFYSPRPYVQMQCSAFYRQKSLIFLKYSLAFIFSAARTASKMRFPAEVPRENGFEYNIFEFMG